MLRKSLIAVALLAASSGAMADDDYVYGRVVTVEPSFSISFGSGSHHDGYRVMYEVGGRHYWTHSHDHPGEVIWVQRPPGHYVHHHKHHYKGHHGHGKRHHGRGHDWDD